MEAQFLDHNNSELKQRRRLRQREMEKSKWFISEKQLRTSGGAPAHVHHAFVYVSQSSLHDCDVNS